ncbi:hypothetical protein O2N63_11445 [Aliiroseovarius sp. KMU-50]|uniref:Uncharacterized protein n=1 Tax=Aliiroseovarius salicola TaxID=3009082 RepID=A0ABT4W4M3_9RHOB|nr:hypothetical protein [Aliiroseovarius sp. KMU-50]MDA5094698.1 hypothetical protein [Aliiroseovarius sp. KMU-50]
MSDPMVTRDEMEKMFGDVLKPGKAGKPMSEEERIQRVRAERLRVALYPKED